MVEAELRQSIGKEIGGFESVAPSELLHDHRALMHVGIKASERFSCTCIYVPECTL